MDLNKDINFSLNPNTLNILYRKYKNFLLPVFIIIGCLVTFFIIVTPQLRALLNTKDQEKLEQQKLQTLKNNYNLLSNMNENSLNSNFQILTKTLPSTKDFAGIVNSISYNSLISGVVVGDFQFNVGDVEKAPEGALFPNLQMKLNISGGPNAIMLFISNLYKSAPLAEVTNIKQSGTIATLSLQFYFKAFPQNSINNDIAISQLLPKDLSLISTISSWSNSSLNSSSSNQLPIISPTSTLEGSLASPSSSSPF